MFAEGAIGRFLITSFAYYKAVNVAENRIWVTITSQYVF